MQYEDCPSVCVENGYDANRRANCIECPNTKALNKFKKDFYQLLDVKFKGNGKEIGFDKAFATCRQIISLKDLPPDKMTVKTSCFVNTYLNEEIKYQEIESS